MIRITRTNVPLKEVEAFVRNIQHHTRNGWYRRDWKIRPESGTIACDNKWNLLVGYKRNTGFYYARTY